MTGFDEARMMRVVEAMRRFGGSYAQAGRALGLTREQIRRAMDSATLRGIYVPMPSRDDDGEPAANDPSADEIWNQYVPRIQAGWSDEVRAARSVSPGAAWIVPAPGRDFSEAVG